MVNSVIAFKKMTGLKTLGFGRPDAPMTMEVRKILSDEFDGEISILESILERDFSSWRG